MANLQLAAMDGGAGVPVPSDGARAASVLGCCRLALRCRLAAASAAGTHNEAFSAQLALLPWSERVTSQRKARSINTIMFPWSNLVLTTVIVTLAVRPPHAHARWPRVLRAGTDAP